jgi:hypothetical protein
MGILFYTLVLKSGLLFHYSETCHAQDLVLVIVSSHPPKEYEMLPSSFLGQGIPTPVVKEDWYRVLNG